MAKMVGLSRKITLGWLNKAAEFYMEREKDTDVKKQLSDYLSFEISSATNLRKTTAILLHVWCFEDVARDRLREQAQVLLAEDNDNALLVHWCMLLAAYPIFIDSTKLIGKLLEFQDEFKLSTLKDKVFEQWGERATLYHSLDKIMATFIELGALERIGNGLYKQKNKLTVNKKAKKLILHTMLILNGGNSINMDNLNDNPVFFPFEYNITMEDLLYNENVTVQRFGDMFTVELKKDKV